MQVFDPAEGDLVLVDYIIITVTCLLVGGSLIGGIVFGCQRSKESVQLLIAFGIIITRQIRTRVLTYEVLSKMPYIIL